MGRLLRSACLVIGLLLAGGGAVGAALVGTDDIYLLDSMSTGAEPGQVVATHTDITDWEQLELVVRAEAEGGAVLALGHTVDVTDYLDGTDHRLVTGLAYSELYSTSVDGAAPAVPVPDVGAWLDVTSGDGPQQLTVALGDQPVRLLAAPLAEDGTVALALGIRVEGAFVLLVVTAVVGALLAALSVRALWRRRSRGRDGTAGSPDGPQVPPQRRPDPSRTPVAQRRALPLARLVVVPLVSALALSGCGHLPEPASGGLSGKVAMTDEQLPDLVSDYETRWNRALRAARKPRYDFSAWQRAESGAALENIRYFSTALELQEEQVDLPRAVLRPETLFSGVFDSYPMWAAVAIKHNRSLERKSAATDRASSDGATGDEETRMLTLFTRNSVTDTWRRSNLVEVDVSRMPTPARTPSTPEPQAWERATEAAAAVHHFWDTGKRPEDVRLGAATRKRRKDIIHIDGNTGATGRAETSPWGWESERLRLIPVQGGHLAISVADVKLWIQGEGLSWKEPWDRLNGSSGGGLYSSNSLVTAILLPDDGTPEVLGSRVSGVFS